MSYYVQFALVVKKELFEEIRTILNNGNDYDYDGFLLVEKSEVCVLYGNVRDSENLEKFKEELKEHNFSYYCISFGEALDDVETDYFGDDYDELADYLYLKREIVIL